MDENGEQLGIVNIREALQSAQERGLDLIEVAPQAVPPVCRIMDYGKYKYEQGKRERDAHKKHRQAEIKGVKLRPVTADHDFQVKTKSILKFLSDGDKVKVTVTFRSREITHPEIAKKILDRLVEMTNHAAVVEKPASIEGRMMTLVLSPK
ncbi:MAG: translation initiation factor IF-3 [Armatimonadetes bacterium]|nr:translation initiation factor IF-3 [Armatimonadota bacterium]